MFKPPVLLYVFHISDHVYTSMTYKNVESNIVLNFYKANNMDPMQCTV